MTKIKKLKNTIVIIYGIVFLFIVFMIFQGMEDNSIQLFVTSIVRIFSYLSLAIVILIKMLEYIYRDKE